MPIFYLPIFDFFGRFGIFSHFWQKWLKKAETGTWKIGTSDFLQAYTLKKGYQSWNATRHANRTKLVSDDIQLHTIIRHHSNILEQTNDHKYSTQPRTRLTQTPHHNVCYATWMKRPWGWPTRRSRLANSTKIFVFPTSSQKDEKKDEMKAAGIHNMHKI